ncbi:hypothetical protein CY35_18G101700 [Sphagnum magellanicum]|nr:hypothetical protein CY35_18G101700 [Sphagnum magellanicum]
MASFNCPRGKLIVELKRAMDLGASRFLGGKTKIHAVMRFEALSRTAKKILDMGNNPVWKEEIFHIDLNGCSDETLLKIEIYKDESKLIGSLVLTVLELCVMEGVTLPRVLPLMTPKGKPHGQVEILTTYLSLEHHAPSGPSEPLPLVMGDFQPTAPAWDLPFVPQVPDVYQEPNADHFQNQHPSRVQEPDHKPPNAQLPKPKPSKPTIDPFYAYF